MQKSSSTDFAARILSDAKRPYNSPCRLILLLVTPALLGLGGCPQKNSLGPIPDPITLDQTLDYYHNNVRAVTDFSAKIQQWEIQFYQEEKKHHFKETGGKLFYRPPQPTEKYPWFNLTALGGPLSQEALVVASNQEQFWIKSKPAEWSYRDTHENAGRLGAENITIINPQFILELIGLRPIPLEQLPRPFPIYKIWPEQNVIEYALPQDTALREIVIDRRSNLPARINLYDQSGRRVVESHLSNYQPLGQAMLPGDITLFAPYEDSYFRLKLKNFHIPSQISPRLFILETYLDRNKDK